MSRPRSITIPCPDCGGPVRSQGKRRGTDIKRYVCLNEGDDKECNRRFTDNTMAVKRKDAHKNPPVTPTKEALATDTDVYIFTWSQNATPVHPGFWRALIALQNHRDADLNVIQGRYLNRTGMVDRAHSKFADLWWVEETITRGMSGILGHPKLAMKVIATPEGMPPKQLLTTGACTIANYTDSKAGMKGMHHHTLGATIVEVAPDGTFFMRQINATTDGSFIDKATQYNNDGTYEPAGRALAISLGDWHSGMTNPDVIAATFGIEDSDGSMVAVLKPKELFWDDLIDFYGRNHHHQFDPFIGIGKSDGGAHAWNDMRLEIEGALWEVDNYTKVAIEAAGGHVQSIVKADNHGEAFTRYMRERNWKNDPVNAEFYLETALKITQQTKMTKIGVQYPEALAVWGKELCPDAIFLTRHDRYAVADIECSFHGDIGPNGARGSINAFSKIGVKVIIGHTHTPGIENGAYQNGTSTYIPLGYTKGPSSWMNSHTVIYANGKRALITMVGNRWHHE